MKCLISAGSDRYPFDSFLPALLGSTRHDFGWLGWISFDYTFLSALLSIILIDLVLAGDNAVVIALAVRNLQGKQKKWGIILGAGAAVLLRVICTMFVAQMLMIPLLKFVGGALIAWIAVKLLTQEDEDEKVDQAKNLIQAIKLIVIADIVMSTRQHAGGRRRVQGEHVPPAVRVGFQHPSRRGDRLLSFHADGASTRSSSSSAPPYWGRSRAR